MIFVTVGTSEPFDRLLSAVSTLTTDEEIVVQAGRSAVRPRNARIVEFMPYAEVVQCMQAARVVVSHAGVGSIVTALANGRQPVVVPRRRALGEAVDDHQVALARRLAEAGLVVDLDPDDLQATLATPRADASITTDGRLAAEIRDYVRHVLAGGRR